MTFPENYFRIVLIEYPLCPLGLATRFFEKGTAFERGRCGCGGNKGGTAEENFRPLHVHAGDF